MLNEFSLITMTFFTTKAEFCRTPIDCVFCMSIIYLCVTNQRILKRISYSITSMNTIHSHRAHTQYTCIHALIAFMHIVRLRW